MRETSLPSVGSGLRYGVTSIQRWGKVKRTVFLLMMTVFITPQVQANVKSYTTPKSAVIVTDGKAGARVCYYQDQAYSIGAVIQVGEVYLVCQPNKDFELNGALKWQAYEIAEQSKDVKKDGQ